jgi:hypothetical protein
MSTPLARACICSLLLPTACFEGNNQPCSLRHGLSAEKTRLEQEYNAPVGKSTGERYQVLDSLAVVDKEYYDFLQSLAEAAQKDDKKSLQVCRSLAAGDPLASQMVALVVYLHNGRKDAAHFVASFPASKQQLTNFWSLDAISTGGTTEVPTSLPGILLPDGLVDKYITELFSLAVTGNSEAMRKYFYLYEDADGGQAEFMEDQATGLFRKHADLVLREWTLFRPLAKRLAASEAVPLNDYKAIVRNFRKLCSNRRSQRCAEVLTLFHP